MVNQIYLPIAVPSIVNTFTLKSKSYPTFVTSISVAVSPSVTLYEAGSKKTVRSRKSGII